MDSSADFQAEELISGFQRKSEPRCSARPASAAMAFAVTAAMELAGQQVVPPASYSVFRITCRPSLGRFAQRLGFVPHGTGNCQKYLYQK